MGARVTVGRKRTTRARRAAVRASLTAAGVLPTYDLVYGSQCGLLFEEQVREAGFRDLDGGWWPTEERSLHAENAIFREGANGAIYRLEDGTLVLVHLDSDSIRVKAAGPSRSSCRAAVAAFQGLYPASFVNTEGDSRIPVTFWANSNFGPVPRLRRIEASAWEPIVGNYSADVRDQLADLMQWDDGPPADGQLLLWQGPPGTGKTWALRALASEWSRWAEFHYITDPDSFFVDDPSYMIGVLLADSYSVVDSDGEVFEEQAEGKWRVLILEDTGELLSANAKEKYGQGLSRLLNVVDGMIGQGLRVLCLVTTNDELGELNEAVRRPGRCASQIVFGPLSDDEAQAWTGDPDARAGTIAELYSAYGKAETERDPSFTEEPEDGRDLMAAGDELIPIPGAPHVSVRRSDLDAVVAMVTAAREEDTVAEIRRVAEEHRPDGGYGETAWHSGDRAVFWVCADWTSDDEHDAAENAFRAIDGVDDFQHEAEAALPKGDGWQQVWPAPRDDEAALDAVVALALEPLDVAPEPEPVVAAAAEPPREEPTTGALIEVLGRFADREPAPAPTFHLHFPQHLGVTLERQDITVPVTLEPTPPTPLEVHTHSVVEVPEQAAPIVHNHMPDLPAPVVHNEVIVPAQAPTVVVPDRRVPSFIRVDFDAEGNKLYTPVYDDELEETQA